MGTRLQQELDIMVRASQAEERAAQLQIQLDTAVRALQKYARVSNWRKDDWNIMAIFQPDYGEPGKTALNALRRIKAREYKGEE